MLLQLSRATSEFKHQYSNLVHLRVGQLVNAGNGMFEFHIIDTPENTEALTIAYQLVTEGEASTFEVDNDARVALQADHQFVESLTASAELRRRDIIPLDDDEAFEIETLLLKGAKT